MLPIRHRRSCVGNSRDECRRHRKRPLQVPQSPESGTIPTTAVAHGAPHFRGFADRHVQRQRVLGWKNGTSPAGCREKGRTMITFRRLMGAPKSMGGATEPSLVGIAVGLKVAEERLAALAPIHAWPNHTSGSCARFGGSWHHSVRTGAESPKGPLQGRDIGICGCVHS
jgi:hypothetical protein